MTFKDMEITGQTHALGIVSHTVSCQLGILLWLVIVKLFSCSAQYVRILQVLSSFKKLRKRYLYLIGKNSTNFTESGHLNSILLQF